ncbi:uncharacterized protein BDV17DRAFT_285434 [Aspergillus undulatus]|uniref:uncharacterized protein n=1 Tax=Aspergillus undulatus TaxID=1810928 RepID=UPI003CCE146B
MARETQDYSGVGGQVPTPTKFSRYRSVRKAASTNAQGMAPLNTSVPPVPTRQSASATASQDAGDWYSGSTTTIKKSMSRYRRQKPPTPNSADVPPPLPVPSEQYVSRAQPAASTLDNHPTRRPSKDTPRPEATTPRARLMDAMRLDTRGKGLFGDNSNTSSDAEHEERERDRQDAMNSLTGGCTESPATSTNRQRLATRGRAATDREVQRAADSRRQVDDAASRRHSHNEPTRKSFKDAMKSTHAKDKTKKSPSDGGDTNAPAMIDAPVSAVNAGERQVPVQYGKHSLKLSVSPSTSAHDILVSASRSISEINPTRFILMESFTAQGLERPLRQYECVRDVMNSWAHDAENTLIIVPAPNAGALDFLAARNVPSNSPLDATFHIYYSQKPRKWDKRYLTIRSDGQITLSKKDMAKEQINVCHLSDFDIYSPTPTFLSDKVKPPKKICYAIKSQQKASMFLTTENFIHFFATNDKSNADGWYRAVQTWRSWYLINRLGAGQAEGNDEPECSRRRSREYDPPPSSFPKSLTKDPDTTPTTSSDESPFAAGGLLGRAYTLRHKAMKEREEREKREAEVLFNQGLVGSSAAPRQHSASRPGSRTNSITSAQQPELDSLLKRSQSIKQAQAPGQPKPLVDLTPVYQEPPQHTRKGRGVTVDTGGPLIDAATGIESAGGINVPPAKTWRRPTVPAATATTTTTGTPPLPPEPTSEVRTRNRSNTARSAIGRYRHNNNNTTTPSSSTSPAGAGADFEPTQEEASGFVPNSLLARAGTGNQVPASGAPIGHGVATGDRNATKPMLDVTPKSPFAEGSLLRGL